MNDREYAQALIKLSELMDEGVQCFDSEGVTFFYNEKMSQLEETDKNEVIGRSFQELYPNFREGESTVLNAVQHRQATINKRQTYFNRAGKQVTTINTTVPLLEGNRVIGAMEIAKDIALMREKSSTVEPGDSLPQKMKRIEDQIIMAVMKENKGNISKAARQLGIKRQCLQYKLKKMDK